MPEDSSQAALDLLGHLNQLSLEILESLEHEQFDSVVDLMKKRQEFIEALGELDAFRPGPAHASRSPLPDEISKEFKKLLASGEHLTAQVSRKKQLLDMRRRQSAVTRSTVRGYRPRPRPPLSTRTLKT